MSSNFVVLSHTLPSILRFFVSRTIYIQFVFRARFLDHSTRRLILAALRTPNDALVESLSCRQWLARIFEIDLSLAAFVVTGVCYNQLYIVLFRLQSSPTSPSPIVPCAFT
jgi:hypothetical protein